MMTFRKIHRFIGLDAGNSAVRAVLVEDGQAVDFQEWNARADGALDEEELLDGAAELLKQNGWEADPVLAGLPQFRCSTLYKVFPPGNDRRLAEMVAFETEQLSGVSDEPFLKDFTLLRQPEEQSGKPVLIGICREQDIETLQSQYLKRAVRLSGMSMHGLSLMNAFYDLHPEALSREAPVLLLDLGHENATVVITAAGQALFMGTLMLAGSRFLEALDSCNQVLEKHGGTLSPADVDFNAEAMHSPLLETARALDGEIQNIVEHWRSQEADDYWKKPVEKIWLSGGGADFGNLADWLAGYAEVPVAKLGPVWKGRLCPEFTIAYGLALEAAGKALSALRFQSAALAEKRRRQSRLPVLAAACIFFCAALFLSELMVWQHQNYALAVCQEKSQRLGGCGNILPEIQFLYLSLKTQEKKILPLVIYGRNTRQILAASEILSDSLADGEWCIYLADQISYQGQAPSGAADYRGRSSAAGQLFDGFAQSDREDHQVEFPGAVSVETMRETSGNWIAAGFVPVDAAQPYRHVKALTLKLRRSPLFREADLFHERNGRDRLDVFMPWVRHMKDGRSHFKSFTLLIPRQPLENSGREMR